MKRKKNIGLVLIGLIAGALIGTLNPLDFQDKQNPLIVNGEEVSKKEITSFLVDYNDKQAFKDFIVYKHLKSIYEEEELTQQGLNSGTFLSLLEEEYINKLIEVNQEEFEEAQEKHKNNVEVSYYTTNEAGKAHDIQRLVEEGNSLLTAVMEVAGEQEATKILKGEDTVKSLGIEKGVTIKSENDKHSVVVVDNRGLAAESEFRRSFAQNLDTYLFDQYLESIYVEAQAEWEGEQILR